MYGRTDSAAFALLGALAFLVGLVGYVAFGWQFDGSGSQLSTVLGVGAVVVAIVATILRRR